jgi:zinc/manganese transport system ATP-binding protein
VEAQQLAARALCELSGGELQRLLLAQALLGKPRLLLLDEPLLSLDPRFQETVVTLVREVQKREAMTVLFTAHELNPLLGAMDRVLYLGHGSAAIGSVDEVITSDVLSRLYGTPIEVLRVNGRIVVVSGYGAVEADAHRHDA